MTGLIIKLIVCPSVVYLSSLLFNDLIFFSSFYQIIIVGIVLAVGAHIMEVWFLNKKTIWTSTGLDFVAATMIVYLSSFIFLDVKITLLGALITAFLLSITEVIQHYYLTNAEKVEH